MSELQWNPDVYERFKAQRAKPLYHLLDMVRPRPGMRVVDLGCGTGELTRVVHQRLQARETLGIDSAAAMIEKSGQHAAPGLRFVQTDIRDLDAEERFDLVLSNAALQWLDGHEALLERLSRCLSPGGQIAVQVPANHDHVSHLVAREVAAEPEFAGPLGGFVRTSPVLAVEAYAELLYRLGFVEQRAELRVYGHVLESSEEMVDWVRGTLLLAYQQRLPETLFGLFMERYRQRLLEAVGEQRPCFYPFKRILMWGQRSDLGSR